MRLQAQSRFFLLVLPMLLMSIQAFAEPTCFSQLPAYKVCFIGYQSFVDNRQDMAELGLDLNQYIPDHCYLERLETTKVTELVGRKDVIRSVTPVSLEEIAPFLVARADEECSSHKEDEKCNPGRRAGIAFTSGELMVRFDDVASANCFLFALQNLLRKERADAGADFSKLLEVAGPFDDEGRSLTTDQLKVVLLPPTKLFLDSFTIFSRLVGKAEAKNSLAAGLSDWGILRIDPFEYATLRNGTTTGVIQSGDRYSKSLFDRGLDGDGEIIGLIDAPLDTDHCFMKDLEGDFPGTQHRKLQGYRPSLSEAPSLHGTFVAGILAGKSSKDPDEPNNGQAPKARFSFDSVREISSRGPIRSVLYQTLESQRDDGARIFSNSWGDSENRWYTNWAYDIDRFSHDHEDSLVLFAVHNDDRVMSPENAKNVLAVGASKQADLHEQKGRAGKGPTCDCRRKPEIFAPGCQIRSAIADEEKDCRTGGAPARHQHDTQNPECPEQFHPTSCATSWACPAVAGAAALARQHLKGAYPSGALLKATLLNGTQDMTGVVEVVDKEDMNYPNNIEGWGRLVLDDALYFATEKRKVIMDDVLNCHGFMPAAPDRKYKIKVAESGEPLKVTLVWTDPPPAKTVRCRPVVNDLDLRVQKLGCAEGARCSFLGNAFSAAGVSQPYPEYPEAKRDKQNNVEQVLIDNPTAGEYYCISVVGKEINVEKQGYALVITGAIAEEGDGC